MERDDGRVGGAAAGWRSGWAVVTPSPAAATTSDVALAYGDRSVPHLLHVLASPSGQAPDTAVACLQLLTIALALPEAAAGAVGHGVVPALMPWCALQARPGKRGGGEAAASAHGTAAVVAAALQCVRLLCRVEGGRDALRAYPAALTTLCACVAPHAAVDVQVAGSATLHEWLRWRDGRRHFIADGAACAAVVASLPRVPTLLPAVTELVTTDAQAISAMLGAGIMPALLAVLDPSRVPAPLAGEVVGGGGSGRSQGKSVEAAAAIGLGGGGWVASAMHDDAPSSSPSHRNGGGGGVVGAAGGLPSHLLLEGLRCLRALVHDDDGKAQALEGGAVHLLLPWLTHSDTPVRLAAAGIAAMVTVVPAGKAALLTGCPDGAHAVLNALHDADPRVRQCAVATARNLAGVPPGRALVVHALSSNMALFGTVFPGSDAVPDLVLQLGAADAAAVARSLKGLMLLTGAGSGGGGGLALSSSHASASTVTAVLREAMHSHAWLDRLARGRYPHAAITMPVPAKERSEAAALLDRIQAVPAAAT